MCGSVILAIHYNKYSKYPQKNHVYYYLCCWWLNACAFINWSMVDRNNAIWSCDCASSVYNQKRHVNAIIIIGLQNTRSYIPWAYRFHDPFQQVGGLSPGWYAPFPWAHGLGSLEHYPFASKSLWVYHAPLEHLFAIATIRVWASCISIDIHHVPRYQISIDPLDRICLYPIQNKFFFSLGLFPPLNHWPSLSPPNSFVKS